MLNFILFFVLIFYTGVFGEDSIPNIFIHKNPYAQIETFNIPTNKTQTSLNLKVSKLTPKNISGTFLGTNINFTPESQQSLEYFALNSIDNLPLKDISKGNHIKLKSFIIPMENKGNIITINQNSFLNKLYLLGVNKTNNTLEKLYQYKSTEQIRTVNVSMDSFDSIIYIYNRPIVYANYQGCIIKDDLSPFTYALTPPFNISGDKFTDFKDWAQNNPTFIKDETSSFKQINLKDYTSCYFGWSGIYFQHYYPTYYSYHNVNLAIGLNFSGSYDRHTGNILQLGFKNWDGTEINHSYYIKQKDEIIKLNLHVPPLPINEKGTLNIFFTPDAKDLYRFSRFGDLIDKKNHISSNFSGGLYFTADYGDKLLINNVDCPLFFGSHTRHRYSEMKRFIFKDSTFEIGFHDHGYLYLKVIKLGKEDITFPIKLYRQNKLVGDFTINIKVITPITINLNIDKRFKGYLNLSGNGTSNDFSENLENYNNIFQINTPVNGFETKVFATQVENAISSEQKGNYKIYTLKNKNKIAVKTLEEFEDNYLKNCIFFKEENPLNNVKITLNNGRTLFINTKLIETKTYKGTGEANITTIPPNIPYTFSYTNTSYNNQSVKSNGDFSLENVQGYLPQPGGINKSNILNKLNVIINGKVEPSNGTTFENDKYLLSINEKGDLIFKKKNPNITYEDNITLEYLYNNMSLGSLDLKLYNFPEQKIQLFLDGRIKNCYSDLSGNGAEYLEDFFSGDREDFSQLIHIKKEPQLAKYVTTIEKVKDSDFRSIHHDYKYYYKNSDEDPCILGKNNSTSETDYVKKNIMLHFRTDTKNYSLQLDNCRKLDFDYIFNKNKFINGQSELSLANLTDNTPYIFDSQGTTCQITNSTGTSPNGAGLNKSNIVDNLVITINGTKYIIKGSTFENDKYKIYFNNLGKLCFQKKNYNHSYEDNIIIDYYCTKLKLGTYTLKVK